MMPVLEPKNASTVTILKRYGVFTLSEHNIIL